MWIFYRLIDFELYCIHAISQSSKKFLFKSSSVLEIFCLLFRLLIFWIVNETIEIVVLELFLDDLNIRNSLRIEVFSKLRLIFQSSWWSWFVIIAMNNRKLEMNDACRWKCQRDSMIEVTKYLLYVVNFLLCWMIYFCNFSTLRIRTCSLNWTIRDSKIIQLIMIAIFSCML